MKRITFFIFAAFVFGTMAPSVFAQEDDAVVQALRSGFSERAASEEVVPSQGIPDREPALGESVAFKPSDLPVTAAKSASTPYLAGRDTVSGTVAAIAVLLAAFVGIFIFLIASPSARANREGS